LKEILGKKLFFEKKCPCKNFFEEGGLDHIGPLPGNAHDFDSK
jgi:hypothetical protein